MHELPSLTGLLGLPRPQAAIDALNTGSSMLAEYQRWLQAAAKRLQYLKERALQAMREQKKSEAKGAYAARGAVLQQAAWNQRAAAIEERQQVVRSKIANACSSKREAGERKVAACAREERWRGHVAALHSEVAEVTEEARQARTHLADHRAAGARTLRAAHKAIEGRKGEQEREQVAHARATRDRVKASMMRRVPAEVAAAIEHSMRHGHVGVGISRGSMGRGQQGKS